MLLLTCLQAKENFKVRDAFETLIRKILTAKPSAGRNEGSGGVFGAGVAQRYCQYCYVSTALRCIIKITVYICMYVMNRHRMAALNMFSIEKQSQLRQMWLQKANQRMQTRINKRKENV